MAEAAKDVNMTGVSISSSSGKKKEKPSKGHEIITKTIKTPPFSYAYLELLTSSASETNLDDLTVRSYITAALTQFLGLTGSAISIDILKVEGRECWIRFPREDLSPVVAALGGWVGGHKNDGQVGWRVKGSGNWLSMLVAKKGVERTWDA